MKTLNDWRDDVHAQAVRAGWWSKPTDTIPAKLLLVHSELSEAVEAMRDARPCPKGAPDVDYDDLRAVTRWNGKPEGFAVEIADTVIRLLDLAGQIGLDLDALVQMKHEFNATRAERHGGKLI